MFAVLISRPFHRVIELDRSIVVMNIHTDDEAAKRAWLKKLDQPFGFNIEKVKDDEDRVEKKETSIEVDETEGDQVQKTEKESAKQAWFDMLNREVRHRDKQVARKAWLAHLQKPVVHSDEELAKQTWFAKFKKAASESE